VLQVQTSLVNYDIDANFRLLTRGTKPHNIMFVIPSAMFKSKVGIHHVYPLYCVWTKAQGIHTQNHGPGLLTTHSETYFCLNK